MDQPDLSTQLLLARLDSQDKVLDRLLSEAKRTNGRVTALEERSAINAALATTAATLTAQRRSRFSLVFQSACIILSGAVGAIGQGAGWW